MQRFRHSAQTQWRGTTSGRVMVFWKILGSCREHCLRTLLMNLLIIADDESVGPQIRDCTVDVLVLCGDLPDE